MKQSKRMLAMILSLVMVFSLFACSAQADPQTDDADITVSVKDPGQDPALQGKAAFGGGANIESDAGPQQEIEPVFEADDDNQRDDATEENANIADEPAPEADSEESQYHVTVEYRYEDGSEAADPVEFTVTPSERYTVKTPGTNTKADDTAHVLSADFTNPPAEAQVEIKPVTAVSKFAHTEPNATTANDADTDIGTDTQETATNANPQGNGNCDDGSIADSEGASVEEATTDDNTGNSDSESDTIQDSDVSQDPGANTGEDEPVPGPGGHEEPAIGDVYVEEERIVRDDCIEVVHYVYDANNHDNFFFSYSTFEPLPPAEPEPVPVEPLPVEDDAPTFVPGAAPERFELIYPDYEEVLAHLAEAM